jgi:hypothetical protein
MGTPQKRQKAITFSNKFMQRSLPELADASRNPIVFQELWLQRPKPAAEHRMRTVGDSLLSTARQ